jgi:feruloyl esterase
MSRLALIAAIVGLSLWSVPVTRTASAQPPARPAAPAGSDPGAPPVPVGMIPLPEGPTLAPVRDCASLTRERFDRVPDGPARVLSAEVEAARPGRAEFCLVKGYVAPTIQFELRLPTAGYTGRYLQGGCGGNCGRIPNYIMPACDTPVAFSGAFAVGFEDSGHVGGDGTWALGGEQVRVDFAYRAAHAFSQAAKAIIAAYYGQPPAYSYFQGCSDGGREAMATTQRYPRDFQGVIAGSPAHYITEAMERFLWEARWGHDKSGRPVFDQASVSTLHAAVMRACDGLDGAADGQIDDPRRCRLDPRTLLCPPGQTSGCLTREQAEAARRFYEGPTDAQGRRLYLGGEPYGAEMTWIGPGALSEAGLHMLDDAVRNMMFGGDLPDSVTVRTWRFDVPTFRELSRRGAIYDARSPDLRAFRAAGGKLILWQGQADPAAGSYGVPDYYARLAQVVGGLGEARRFARLFMIPGVYHCRGGYVPYEEDLLGTMVSWVERGVAPDTVEATARLADGRLRRRPMFAYPVRARYVGSGDVNDARNFVAEAPASPPNDIYEWVGSDLGRAPAGRAAKRP